MGRRAGCSKNKRKKSKKFHCASESPLVRASESLSKSLEIPSFCCPIPEGEWMHKQIFVVWRAAAWHPFSFRATRLLCTPRFSETQEGCYRCVRALEAAGSCNIYFQIYRQSIGQLSRLFTSGSTTAEHCTWPANGRIIWKIHPSYSILQARYRSSC